MDSYIKKANQKLYGETVKIIQRTQDYIILDYDCKAKGILISYELFPGLHLIFTDFNSSEILDEPTNMSDNILEIRHCNKGRVEFEFQNRKITHLQQGEFCINAAANLPATFSFPFEYFDGVSLIIDKDQISDKIKNQFVSFDIDIQTLGDKLELHKQWYICKTPAELIHIFDELYEAKGKNPISYFRIKVIELLHYVNRLSIENRSDITYRSKAHIEIVKKIRNKLITDLSEKITLESLILEEDISMVTFQSVFKQIYGDSPYAYLKNYKMNCAATMLREKNEKINQIAISLGYNNASKFSKAFKDVFGLLPKDYRAKIKVT